MHVATREDDEKENNKRNLHSAVTFGLATKARIILRSTILSTHFSRKHKRESYVCRNAILNLSIDSGDTFNECEIVTVLVQNTIHFRGVGFLDAINDYSSLFWMTRQSITV